MQDQKMTLQEAAQLARVSRQTLWRRIRAGKLATTTNPRDLRIRLIDRGAVERYFELEESDMQKAA
jgi:predicted site-specific integrase-resolvase